MQASRVAPRWVPSPTMCSYHTQHRTSITTAGYKNNTDIQNNNNNNDLINNAKSQFRDPLQFYQRVSKSAGFLNGRDVNNILLPSLPALGKKKKKKKKITKDEAENLRYHNIEQTNRGGRAPLCAAYSSTTKSSAFANGSNSRTCLE